MQKTAILKLALALTGLLGFQTIQAQNASFNLDVLPLWHPSTGPYLDLLCYVQSAEGVTTEIAAWIEKDGKIIAVDKITMTAPNRQDS